MFKNKGMFRVPVLIMATLLVGCGTTRSTQEQQFQGVIFKDKKPAVSTKVRLVTASKEDCDAKGGTESQTDKKGRFQLSRTVRGDDTTRQYRLCAMVDDSWETLWSETRGPSPRSVEFECDLTDRYKDKCWVSWDREGFKRGSWTR